MTRIVGNSSQREETLRFLRTTGAFAVTGPTHLGKRTFIRASVRDEFDDTDFLEVRGSVSDARTASDFLQLRSLSGSRKVVIVDCCDGISDAAQDAFLKPCEEGLHDSSIAFILQDERYLSDALTSRMRNVVRWKPLSSLEMTDFLGGDVDEDIMSVCGGRPGLYDVIRQIDVSAIRDAIMDRRAIERPVPPDVKGIKSGRSAERDALCSILMSVSRSLIATGSVSRAIKAMSLADVIESIPSTSVDVYWRRAWTVPDVI